MRQADDLGRRSPASRALRASGYRSKQLGRPDCASVLDDTLKEEKATDEKLSALALKAVNRKAA
jgi:ferritin-like metal-binding protein YciE